MPGASMRHSSTNNLMEASARTQIFNALLQNTPSTMMVQFRKPYYLAASYPTPLAVSSRFTGTAQARAAHHNDCFLAGVSNGGTFDPNGGMTFQQSRDYTAAITPYTAVGGETCDIGGLGTFNDGDVAISEMGLFHWDYLNKDFWATMISKWQTQGKLAEISRRLGYGFVLNEATAPTTVAPGRSVSVSLKLTNSGFKSSAQRSPSQDRVYWHRRPIRCNGSSRCETRHAPGR